MSAVREQKPAPQVATIDEGLELVTDERRQCTGVLVEAGEELRQVLADDRDGVASRGVARDVRRRGSAAGHEVGVPCGGRAMGRAP